MALSNARRTLERARRFLDRAVEAGVQWRTEFEDDLEAAIIFGKSVDYHLQAEFKHVAGFQAWHDADTRRLKAIPLVRWMVGQRDYAVHTEPLKTHSVWTVNPQGGIRLSGTAIVKVVRGQSWYRRPRRVLWEDLRHSAEERARHARARFSRIWRRARPQRAAVLARVPPSSTTTTQAFYFNDRHWGSRPAVDLGREYLNVLDQIVAEAEARFRT
jgi:hypothetical protein